MLRLLTTLMLMSFFSLSGGHAETNDDVFQSGLALYQKHDYPAALEKFNAALERGPVTARVLHNVALTHYQMNQKPFALAYWRKALAVDPNYAPARTGRDLLENRMRMRPFERDGMNLYLRQTLEHVSPFLASWAFAALFAIFGWLGLRHWTEVKTAREVERDPPGFPLGTLVAGVLVLASAGVLGLKLSYGSQSRATVVNQQTGVRSLPNDQSVTLFEVAPGGEVLVRRAENGWAQVQNADGATGWVKDSEIVVTSEI